MATSIERGRKVRLAAVGMGRRISALVKHLLTLDAAVEFALAVDINPDAARKCMALREISESIEIVEDIQQLIDRADSLDGVVVGTRCNLHAPIACQLAATGLPLFLEKPVAVSWQQLQALQAAFQGRGDQVVVSFPLRRTVHVRAALEILASGRLGTISQIQAVNNVPYGGVYFAQPYRDYDVTGGLWLQKATHDFDYLHLLMASQPRTIAAMHSRRVFGGDMPQDLWCSACDLRLTCEQSPASVELSGDDGGVLKGDHACTFGKQIKNQDSGSAMVMYDNGAHVSYTQNFVSRRSAGRRGATIIGYHATLSFDWFDNQVIVIDHHQNRVDRISVESLGGHGGGDTMLLLNFLDVVRGQATSLTPLDAGLLSVATCLAARDAAATGVTQRIPAVGKVAAAPYDHDPAIKGCEEIEPPVDQYQPAKVAGAAV